MAGNTPIWRGEKCLVRVRAPKRITLWLRGCKSDREALERLAQIESLVARLIAADKGTICQELARALAEGATAAERAPYVRQAELALKGRVLEEKKLRVGMTVKEFGKLWTSGKLHAQYPDHVPLKKSAHKDVGLLRKYIDKTIGDLPLVVVDLSHIESVMDVIPEGRSSATRRHVYQVLHRLFRLAVYPAKLITSNPMPKGFLPRIQRGRVTAHLYPKDDAKLLACTTIDLARRILYGFLHREGMRREEAVGLTWREIDLDTGIVRLDENKTDDPRAWALDPGTTEALRRWKELVRSHCVSPPLDELPGSVRVFGDAPLPDKAANQYRDDLAAAGVARPELFEKSERRRPVRVHDTRTAFVTLALANGKPERWVMDRTGHTSSNVLQRYHRGARTAAELQLGWWSPLHEAIPELAALGSDRDPDEGSRAETSGKTRQNKRVPAPARDDQVFKIFRSQEHPGSSPGGATEPKTSGAVTTPDPSRPRGGSQTDPNSSPPWPFGPGRAFLVAGPRVLPLRVRARVLAGSP